MWPYAFGVGRTAAGVVALFLSAPSSVWRCFLVVLSAVMLVTCDGGYFALIGAVAGW